MASSEVVRPLEAASSVGLHLPAKGLLGGSTAAQPAAWQQPQQAAAQPDARQQSQQGAARTLPCHEPELRPERAGLRQRRLEALERLSATQHLTAPLGLDQLGSLLGPTTAYTSGLLRGSGRAAEASRL